MRQRVAPSVRRTHLDELDQTTAHLHLEATLERATGHAHLDTVELERAEEVAEQRADVTLGPVERGQHGRWHLGHLVRRGRRGDDLGPVDQLVAIAVVAVGVRVDEGGDGSHGGDRRHRLEHLGREAQVEQRVDQ